MYMAGLQLAMWGNEMNCVHESVFVLRRVPDDGGKHSTRKLWTCRSDAFAWSPSGSSIHVRARGRLLGHMCARELRFRANEMKWKLIRVRHRMRAWAFSSSSFWRGCAAGGGSGIVSTLRELRRGML